jgi:hypothetical protein
MLLINRWTRILLDVERFSLPAANQGKSETREPLKSSCRYQAARVGFGPLIAAFDPRRPDSAAAPPDSPDTPSERPVKPVSGRKLTAATIAGLLMNV